MNLTEWGKSGKVAPNEVIFASTWHWSSFGNLWRAYKIIVEIHTQRNSPHGFTVLHGLRHSKIKQLRQNAKQSGSSTECAKWNSPSIYDFPFIRWQKYFFWISLILLEILRVHVRSILRTLFCFHFLPHTWSIKKIRAIGLFNIFICVPYYPPPFLQNSNGIKKGLFCIF